MQGLVVVGLIGSITLNTGSAGFYHFWTEVSVAV